jgi:hypothetical protein
MSPILKGVVASGISGRLSNNSFESIATVTVGSGGTATATFTSIPQTYKHLQIRCIGRTNRAATSDAAKIRFNSDSGSNYAYHAMYGYRSGYGSSGATPITEMYQDRFAGNSALANVFGSAVIDILDYTSTSKLKTLRGTGGYDDNTNGEIHTVSGLWLTSGSAVTRIDISPNVGTLWNQYSSFALYGIKG